MTTTLHTDQQTFETILAEVLNVAISFLQHLPARSVGTHFLKSAEPQVLPVTGLGASKTLELFRQRYETGLSGSAGPRYFGFVTGGSTPAAVAGDWLTTVYDQNAIGSSESIAPQLELETIGLLRELFGLPPEYQGSFVTGAMMSNFVGLAQARQWVGHQQGVDIAQQGLGACSLIHVLSGTPHSTIYKALSMLGLGRDCLDLIGCQPNREAVDVAQLERRLIALQGEPCIVVANAGTVNTVDYDDLVAIATLRTRYPFWLHVDGAFGGFAACSPHYNHWVAGMDQADSITIDAHKWLNVPYDSAMQFTRHQTLQSQVFQNAAAYLEQTPSPSNFIHLTPESSRRLRAIPAWFTLMAYGRSGYQQIVEHNCHLAQILGAKIEASKMFRLLAPIRLNGLCFTLDVAENTLSSSLIRDFLQALTETGQVFLTPTHYCDVPAIRVSITNWRTTEADIEIVWQALVSASRVAC